MDAVAIGLVGMTLDKGDGPDRWNRWRPTVSLCSHPDLLVKRLELLYEPRAETVVKRITADLRSVSLETVVHAHPLSITDALGRTGSGRGTRTQRIAGKERPLPARCAGEAGGVLLEHRSRAPSAVRRRSPLLAFALLAGGLTLGCIATPCGTYDGCLPWYGGNVVFSDQVLVLGDDGADSAVLPPVLVVTVIDTATGAEAAVTQPLSWSDLGGWIHVRFELEDDSGRFGAVVVVFNNDPDQAQTVELWHGWSVRLGWILPIC